MKIGRVIGRVTLSHADESYRGGRFFLVLPATREHLQSSDPDHLPKGNSAVMYDALGTDIGDLVAYREGGEASMPFGVDTPCDAYNCLILDRIDYRPPETNV